MEELYKVFHRILWEHQSKLRIADVRIKIFFQSLTIRRFEASLTCKYLNKGKNCKFFCFWYVVVVRTLSNWSLISYADGAVSSLILFESSAQLHAIVAVPENSRYGLQVPPQMVKITFHDGMLSWILCSLEFYASWILCQALGFCFTHCVLSWRRDANWFLVHVYAHW